MKWHPLFPGSLKLLVCFCNWPFYKEWSQALTWRADVTCDHIISLKYRAWIGSAERQKARSKEGNAFPTFITDGYCFAALPGCLPKSSSLTVHWESLSPLNLLLMLPTSLARVSINSTSSLKIPMHQSHAIQTVLGEAKPRTWPDVPSWPKTVLVYTCADVIVPLFLSKLIWLEWQVIKTLHYKVCFLKKFFWMIVAKDA